MPTSVHESPNLHSSGPPESPGQASTPVTWWPAHIIRLVSRYKNDDVLLNGEKSTWFGYKDLQSAWSTMWTFPLFSFFEPGDRGPIWVIGSVYLVQPLFLPVPSLKHDSRGPVQVPQVACRLRWVMLIAKVWSMTDRNQTFVPGKIIELVLKRKKQTWNKGWTVKEATLRVTIHDWAVLCPILTRHLLRSPLWYL